MKNSKELEKALEKVQSVDEDMQGKLELKKYCPFDRKHTLHREAKVK